MDAVVVVILALVALVAAVAVGWWLGGRSAGLLKAERNEARGSAEEWRVKFNEAVVNLAAEAEKNKRLVDVEAQLATERESVSSLRAEIAAFKRGETERERAHQDQVKQLGDLKTQLEARFGQLASQALETAHDNFLKRADEKLGSTSAENQQKLKNLLQPVEATLKRYEDGLQRVEKERVGSYESLREQLGQLVQQNDLVRKETQRLANVMTASPKARGRWGEEQLKTILESAGFKENVDFKMQTTVEDDGQKLRPDCVINLPGERCIVVDVKNVWTSFERAYDEDDQEQRAILLKQHAKSMESCASDLSRKSYWKQFEQSPDFVVMFIPGEHILSAAAERSPDMIANAARNGVLIASTINMLALARFFAGMRRQESLAAQAREVAEIGKELYRRMLTMGEHIAKLGTNLGRANAAYNDFVGSFERKVLTQARRFESRGIETGGKPLGTPPILDISPQPLTKLLSTPSNDEPPQIAAE